MNFIPVLDICYIDSILIKLRENCPPLYDSSHLSQSIGIWAFFPQSRHLLTPSNTRILILPYFMIHTYSCRTSFKYLTNLSASRSYSHSHTVWANATPPTSIESSQMITTLSDIVFSLMLIARPTPARTSRGSKVSANLLEDEISMMMIIYFPFLKTYILFN